jgi:GntR family transcriptional regulator
VARVPRPRHDVALAAPDWDPDRSKAEQIRELLVELIHDAAPGSLLPSERSLAERLGVARMTIRQCVDTLHDAGLVRRIPGRGTFVREPRVSHSAALRSFSEDMKVRGMRPGSRRLRVRTVPAPAAVAAELALPAGAPLYRIERLRTADGAPMALERTHLSAQRFPGVDGLLDAAASLHELLADHYGARIDSAEQRVTIARLTRRDAAVLEVPAGSSAFRITGTGRDGMGRPLEHGSSLYRADRYEILLRLNRSAPAAR